MRMVSIDHIYRRLESLPTPYTVVAGLDTLDSMLILFRGIQSLLHRA